MNLDELEQEIRMRRRGRRKEILTIAAVLLLLVGAVVGAWYGLRG